MYPERLPDQFRPKTVCLVTPTPVKRPIVDRFAVFLLHVIVWLGYSIECSRGEVER